MEILIAALILSALWLIAVAPGRSTRVQRAPFEKRTFAHRGLYEKDQSVPENSLPAFAAAVQAGYGVELDVQLSKDKRLVVFHDDTLNRMCGVDARVDALTYEELRALSLAGTNQRIPLFSDVLAVLDGRVPVIVELKAGGDQLKNCALTLEHLRSYKGAYCVESFHPAIVRWFRVHAPEILRGQLSEAYRFSSKNMAKGKSFGMSRLLTNLVTRPQFVAYRIGPKCLSVRAAEWMGAMRVCWTARPDDDWNRLTSENDGIIFEHFRPSQYFTCGGAAPIAERIDQELEQAKAKGKEAYVTSKGR